MTVAGCFLDLNFVVDSSESINSRGPSNWKTTLLFIANITRQFVIGPNDVQVAFVLFSHSAAVEWGLTRYHHINDLTKAIRDVRYLGDITNLNAALYLTRTVVFSPAQGARENAIKVTIILTDGEDNVPREGTPLTIANATLCKNDGLRLIAIGVTNHIYIERLLKIVSSPEDLYTVDDFRNLADIHDRLTTRICYPAHPKSTIILLFIYS